MEEKGITFMLSFSLIVLGDDPKKVAFHAKR